MMAGMGRSRYIIPRRPDEELDAFFTETGSDIVEYFEEGYGKPLLLFRHSYRFPPGYKSPDLLRSEALDYMALLAGPDNSWETFNKELGSGGKELLAVFAALLQEGFPFYVLDEGFIDMVMATSLPDKTEFDLTKDYKPPFPACLFLVPDSRFGNVDSIAYALIEDEVRGSGNVYFGIVVHLSDGPGGGRDTSTIMPGLLLENGRTRSEDLLVDADPETLYRDPEGEVIEVEPKDHRFVSRSREFLVKLFAVLNAEPELLIHEKVVRKVKKTGRKIAEYPRSWAPPKLGKKSSSGGTGEGKRHVHPHYRRGHVRRQHYGKGGQSVKLVWIRPVLVNKKLEEEK